MNAGLDGWLNPLRTRAAGRAEELLAGRVDSQRLRDLLTAGMWGACATSNNGLACLDPPILVASAVSGDVTQADIELAAICLLMYAGIDALDDLMDGDVPSRWPADPSEVLLGACTLTGLVVPGALEALGKQTKAGDLMESFEQMSYRMAAGQLDDLRARGPLAPVEAQRIALWKSGEFAGGLARMATQLVSATQKQVELYVEMGRVLGTVQQIYSDYMDLLKRPSRDLKRGVWTLPIALYHETLDRDEAAEFTLRFQRRRFDDDFDAMMDGTVLNDEQLQEGAILLELQCADGLALLNEAGPLEPAGEGLRRMILANSPMTNLETKRERESDNST